jgi:hypothetical protein
VGGGERRAVKENTVAEPGVVRGGAAAASLGGGLALVPIIEVRVWGWWQQRALAIEGFRGAGGQAVGAPSRLRVAGGRRGRRRRRPTVREEDYGVAQ